MKNTFRNSVIILLAFMTVEATMEPGIRNSSASQKTTLFKKINKFYFLIHGFCYAEMAVHKQTGDIDANFRRYWSREKTCAQTWRSRLHDLADDEALVIIPWRGDKGGPVSNFNSFAASVLGGRCFLLDCPDSFESSFWRDNDDDFNRVVVQELKSALLAQRDQWNDEELHTALHALACCRQLDSLLQQRGYCFDKNQVVAESWGASFDGCVTKYTLNIRRMLGLTNVIDINFDLTVPDAEFLLDAELKETLLLPNGLRLFLFNAGDQAIGLFTMTAHSLDTPTTFVTVALHQHDVTVKSKQGIRLWPQAEVYHLPQAAIGHYEPPQSLVRCERDTLSIPVSAGFVYRLAKAPSYIFAEQGLKFDEFKALLKRAEIEKK